MRTRTNLLAAAVIAAGGALLGRPAPLSATFYDTLAPLQSCCTARDPFGQVIMSCCSMNGCLITSRGCTSLQ